MNVPDECLLCRKKFNWEEPVITKVPEGCFFCLDCSKKYRDDTEYKEGGWLVFQYEHGLEVVEE